MKPSTTTKRTAGRAAAGRYRLDDAIELTAYDIDITPDLTRFTFTGRETIALRARRPVQAITVHATELTITTATARQGRASWPSTLITYDERRQTATIHFGRTLPIGALTLDVAFSGGINDKMHGFYRTAYEVDGQKRAGGATQFEATDARRAFPCWDEPDRKATFRLTLRVPEHVTALSNMPIESESRLPGKLKRVTYATTPKMSTYLLAWVIAELECVQGNDRDGVPIRVWTTTGKKAQGRFALDVAQHCLPYFRRWFDIPYALPKLDMVALPDFASGAMENWGLVTYRETALLVDPKNSSAQAKQRVAEVIDHELAHQWFGNLVTMEWWTDLWLNEGFASYMGPKAVDDQFPEWHIWEQFVAGEYRAALRDDSLKASHPIEIPVKDPHEIREIFDAITYSKGSSVNRMLELYLTERVFRKGLQVYLKRYAYGNARTDDLWAVLEEVSRKPVRAIMASFTRQAGYPVVSVSAQGRRLRLEQRRFVFDGSRAGAQRWSVPIVAIGRSVKRPLDATLDKTRGTMPSPSTGWVKLNAGQGGFYRTAYTPALWVKLSEALSAGKLPAVDALGVLDDAYALARASLLRASQVLDLTGATRRYSDYTLWVTGISVLRGIETLIEDGLVDRLAGFGRELCGPQLQRLGWERRTSDGHLDALLRSLVIAALGHYGDPAVVAEARRRFERFLREGQLLPDIRGAVFATVAEHGDENVYEQLLGIYRASPLQEERVRVLRALTMLRRPELIRRALAFALSDQVRNQDAYVVLGGFGGNRAGREIAWEFVKAHWNELCRRYTDGGLNLMNRVIEGATLGVTSPTALADIRTFFAAHPVRGADRTMKQCLEAIHATIRWAQRDRADLRRRLTR